MLEVNKINSFYDKSHVLHDVSLEVHEAEIVGLLGRNGVGKSTTLKSIMGIVRPKDGSIKFSGKETVGLKPYQMAKLGVGYVPEDRRIFPTLTVRQNLLLGMKSGQKQKTESSWTIEKVYDFFPELRHRDSFKGGNLSGGEQQMLTIGRTLMGDPSLVLIDEPTEGLAPQVVETVVNVIEEIHRSGASVVLVEQSMDVVMDLADSVMIMNKGEIVYKGTPDDLQASPHIIETYLEV
ncbi:MAG TPA: ABC transporter ATP-binding protein [Desulfomonilaceae bacterium]|nr:ABC transporter ATP-binding protein [Desulfomonilaceae bacterium]